MPGRACPHNLERGGPSADNTTNTTRQLGLEFIAGGSMHTEGEGQAESSVHRILRREEQEAVISMGSAWWRTRPEGGGAARIEDQSRLPFAPHSSG